MMCRLLGLLCLLFLFPVVSPGQAIRPFKDLVFAQVAAGGIYETWITVTNRGSDTYTGNVRFYRRKSEAWNPTIDGNALTEGKLALKLPPGSTRTLKITGPDNTESGFCAFIADSSTRAGYLEGNLTYFVRSGDIISDCVGVMPSIELYLSTIPFEDFQTVALALVNQGAAGPASVRLDLYSKDNAPVASRTISLDPNEQWVKFLYEEFGRLDFSGGRLEIQSDAIIAGTALMFLAGQFSALPVQPTMRTYTMETDVFGIRCKGQLTLWADGAYFRGFFMVTEIPGLPAPPEVIPVFGQLYQSKLQLHFFAPATAAGNPETVGYTISNSAFSFSLDSVGNSYIVGTLDKGRFGMGTFSLRRLN